MELHIDDIVLLKNGDMYKISVITSGRYPYIGVKLNSYYTASWSKYGICGSHTHAIKITKDINIDKKISRKTHPEYFL